MARMQYAGSSAPASGHMACVQNDGGRGVKHKMTRLSFQSDCSVILFSNTEREQANIAFRSVQAMTCFVSVRRTWEKESHCRSCSNDTGLVT